MNDRHPLRLFCPVQYYSWGKRGNQSLVAKLAQHAERDLPCAELWVGAHPKAPAMAETAEKLVPLNRLIATDPAAYLGNQTIKRFGPELPFLFKILSVGEPLSIQAHPARTLAEELHRSNRAMYPDANHKPEVSYALTPMALLAGFRSRIDIAEQIAGCPELARLLGQQTIDAFSAQSQDSAAIRLVCQSLVKSQPGEVTEASKGLYRRLENSHSRGPEESWILSLKARYPEGDIGLFFFFLLNLLQLDCGQAIALPPGVPHAYLSGDVAECMAASDNVIRAGLTTKARDPEVLLRALDYSSGQPTQLALPSSGQLFNPPGITEFALATCRVGDFELPAKQAPGLLFSVSGSGNLVAHGQQLPIQPGISYFLPPRSKPFTVNLTAGLLFLITVPD